MSIYRDITERRQAEEQRLALERKLLDSQKLESLGILAGGIAHDFNNMLTAVMGNTELAMMELSETSPTRPYLEEIEKTTLQAADLCRQMLAYSGRGKFVIQRVGINAIIEEMTHLLQISISKKNMLKFHLSPNLPAVDVDAAQMRQVVMNLVINASEAIGDNSGVISVSTGMMRADADYLYETYLGTNLAEGDYVYIEVSDTGCGMSPATKAEDFRSVFHHQVHRARPGSGRRVGHCARPQGLLEGLQRSRTWQHLQIPAALRAGRAFPVVRTPGQSCPVRMAVARCWSWMTRRPSAR